MTEEAGKEYTETGSEEENKGTEETGTNTGEENKGTEDKSTENSGTNTEEENQKLKEDLQRAKEQGVSTEEFEKTRKALEKANKEAAERRQKLKEWEELNADPETVKKMIQEKEEKERKEAEEQGRYQELIDKMRQETQEKQEKADQRVQEMQEKLNKQILDKEVNNAISSQDGISELLDEKVKKNVKLEETDEGYNIKVVDENGFDMVDEKGKKMSLEDYVASLKEHPTFSYAFKAPKVSGAGTKSSEGGGNGGVDASKQKPRSKMTQKEQREFVREYGIKEYQKLPK
jgi:hypothetical protein